jgi:catalase-peroxidase
MLYSTLVGCLLTAAPLASAAACPFSGRSDVPPPGGLHKRQSNAGSTFSQCAVKSNQAGGGTRSSDWWPCQLRLDILRQFAPQTNPLGEEFDYVKAFKGLDCQYMQRPVGRCGLLTLNRCCSQG